MSITRRDAWARRIGTRASSLAYVLKGEVMTKVSGQGPAKIYKVGEMFFEPPSSGARRVRQPESG